MTFLVIPFVLCALLSFSGANVSAEEPPEDPGTVTNRLFAASEDTYHEELWGGSLGARSQLEDLGLLCDLGKI